MTHDTWSGLTPKQDQIWEQLWNEYVPMSGMAQTTGGEILRAMTRIIYRFYNDGDMVGVGYGNETCNSSDRYLESIVPNYVTLNQFYGGQEKEYENQMLKNHRIVFNYLRGEGKETFNLPNTFDSREASRQDYERSYDDDYDNYDDYEEFDM